MRTFLVPVLFVTAFTTALPAPSQVAPPRATQSRSALAGVVSSGSSGCPVDLSARYAEQGAVRSVDRKQAGAGPAYRLSLRPLSSRRITQAGVRIHGYNGSRLLPVAPGVDTGKRGPAETEHFDLAFPAPAGKDLFQSVVYTHSLRGIDWVELEEVTFADGQRWHAPTPGACRVVPDGFLLVGRR